LSITGELAKKKAEREAWLEKRRAELFNERLKFIDDKGVEHIFKPKTVKEVRDAVGVVIGVAVEWEEEVAS
jgi:hypothetical protein